jgi:hypothetical protein
MSGERRYKETGQYAYEAYAAAVGYRNYQGGTMLRWDDPAFPEQVRHAWREAAHAAIKYGWQGENAPETPEGFKHVEGWKRTAGGWTPDDLHDTTTSHRIHE